MLIVGESGVSFCPPSLSEPGFYYCPSCNKGYTSEDALTLVKNEECITINTQLYYIKPEKPKLGDVFYNRNRSKTYAYNGTNWVFIKKDIFIADIDVASNVWEVKHNLNNRHIIVTAYDIDEAKLKIKRVKKIDDNNIKVFFDDPQFGRIKVNKRFIGPSRW